MIQSITPRLQTYIAAHYNEYYSMCVSKHRKGTVKIQHKRQKMVHLYRALTMNGDCRTKSCCGEVGG